MILYYSVHYPKSDKEALLIEKMAPVSRAIKDLAGNIFDNVFKDEAAGTIMAVTVWESPAAFQAAVPAMRELLKDIPFEELEARPRETHLLNSVVG